MLNAATFGATGFIEEQRSATYSFVDSDNDGLPDWWENSYFGSLGTNSSLATDSDGDGTSDMDEFLAGTDPLDISSVSKLKIEINESGARLEWSSVNGRYYQIESSLDLTNWSPITEQVQGSGDLLIHEAELNASGHEYFRLKISF